ncbi:MAG: single-stranded-DNA-specific exonuclease RecJ [Candidatus Neomarinimicrobiota bacterium]|nr:MAG: single-stranded-DNA-specific exonuclease RecJ [Candidatus Neomarinimicrobiota bacterium]
MEWIFQTPDPRVVRDLKHAFQCQEILAKVMANRDLHSREQAEAFFRPSLQHLHDPFLLPDMEKAVDRIRSNRSEGTPILVFGDYDVDGTTGAALLTQSLRHLGYRVEVEVPDRERDGYGLSYRGIEHAREKGADLIITCDCGINAFDQVDYARKVGLDVIITDHHTPDRDLPRATAILNPKLNGGSYPFQGLCGGGVAFKLVQALAEREAHPWEELPNLLELATLGTAADMVPILEENRILVFHGLKRLLETRHPGLRALLQSANLENRDLSVGNLVFSIAPRINAAGRMGDANRAVHLLLSTNPQEAADLAHALSQENTRRQSIQQTMVEEALRMVNAEIDLSHDRAIVLGHSDWSPGVIGIVASRIKEQFHRPTIIIAFDDQGKGKGSARSITGLDLYETLSECQEHLEGFGGHPMAAGCTLRRENFTAFRRAFTERCNQKLTQADLTPRLILEGEVQLSDIDQRFMRFLELMAPYGPGNMRPKFAARGLEVVGNPRLVGNGDHLKFAVKQNGRVLDAIGFNLGEQYEKLITGWPVDLAFVVETNTWQGQSRIQLNVRDIQLHRS